MDDDGESVKLAFGTLPDGVSAGTTNESTVSITDDDVPAVSVRFGAATYSATEGGDNAEITVRLSVPARRQVDILLTAEGHYKATPDDWQGVPASLTFDVGDTSESFTLVAYDDTVEHDGEMVELGFGTLPDGFVAGSPATARVTLMNDDQMQSCDEAVWCGTVQFADKTAEGWGVFELYYQPNDDPPSSLSDDSFMFRDHLYTVFNMSLRPGMTPGTVPAVPDGATFFMNVHFQEPDGRKRHPIPDHYLDWTLYVEDVQLPFSKANGSFIWVDEGVHDLFTGWTPSTTYQLRIEETSFSEHPAATPGRPRMLSFATPGGDGLVAIWERPTDDGGSEVTGYRLQWKRSSDGWEDAGTLSEVLLDARETGYIIGGLTIGTSYTARVMAINGVGDGPASSEQTGTPQDETPWVTDAVVNGPILTLTYDRTLDGNSLPPASAFLVFVNRGLRSVNAVAVDGYTVALTLSAAVSPADSVGVRYILPTSPGDLAIRDADGNYAWSSDHEEIRNATDRALLLPLTAEFIETPGSHNGVDSFTFRISFSESAWVSTGTYWDSLLEAAGAAVTNAWFLDRNTRLWEIVVQPNSDDDVVLALPAGRGCETAGAPCASGSRRLSNRVELTVPGPEVMGQNLETVPNRPATGAPGISGTPRAGETLTATTSQIEDEDGLTDAAFTYQWIRHDLTTAADTDIEGATGQTYTVVDADEGQAIKVRVTFTDDAGNEESLTSYAALAAPAPSEEETGDALDTTPLQLSAAAVDGATLTLTYNEALDGDSVPAADGFEVLVGSDTRTVDAVLVAGSAVTLTLASVVTSEDAATVSYTTPADAASPRIRDMAGNAAASYSSQTVTNDTPAGHDPAEGSDEPEKEPAQNSLPEGLPTISGTVQVGETLTVYTSGISDADGLDNAAFTYQWLADGTALQGATGSTYALVDADEGKTIRVRVTFTDDAGNKETLTSEATDTVEGKPNNSATGAPTISGTVQVGETLTVDASDISDADGLDNATFSYQWISNDGSTDTYIQDATDSTYTLSDDDVGKVIKVRVSFTDDADHEESLISAPTSALAAADSPTNNPATGQPTVGGTAQVGETLTVDTSGISDADGLDNATFSYQWISNDGSTDTDIQDATDSTYTPSDDDEGKAIKVRVAFTDDAGNPETLTSEATDTVEGKPNNPATGAPTISGTVQVVETLTADTSGIADDDGMTGAAFTYQWGAGGADIEEATGATYTLRDEDAGPVIQVWVSFTDDAGNRETLTSAATEAVAEEPEHNSPATGAPAISGTAQVGETLTADTSGIADDDGMTGAAFTYQWVAGGTDIQDATDSTYTPSDDDEGKTIKARVTFTDDAGNPETLTSTATEAVAQAETTEPPPAPQNLSAVVNRGGSVTLIWEAPDDDSVTGYQILRRRPTMGEDTLTVYVKNTGGTASSFTDNDVTADVTHVYRVKAINQAGLSQWSNYVNVLPLEPEELVQNSPATGAPAIGGTAQVGETLTVDPSGIDDTDGLDNAAYSYRWIVNDGTTDTDISDATEASYTLQPGDAGRSIKVRVAFTDDAGNDEALISAATQPVAPVHTVPGAPRHLNVSLHDTGALDVYWEAPDNDGGSPVTGYKVQWKESADSWDTPADVSEATETGKTHTITGLTDGVEYTVRVIALNGMGESEPSGEATGTPRETTPPELSSATVDGATLTLTYNESLDGDSTPAPGAFVVTVGGDARTIDSVAISSSTVLLTLASVVTADDTVAVSYTEPTGDPASAV